MGIVRQQTKENHRPFQPTKDIPWLKTNLKQMGITDMQSYLQQTLVKGKPCTNQDSKLPMKGCNNSTKMSSEGKQATVCLRADWENLLTQATFHRDHYEKNLYTMGKIQKPAFCNLHLREHRIQNRTLRMRRWPSAWQLIWPP